MVYIYADESCKDAHKYLILGGLCLEFKDVDPVLQALTNVRFHHNTHGEVKWIKVSNSKLQFYMDFVDVFFDFATTDVLHFHCLIADTTTFNHKLHNGGDAEIGFNKLIFQLLLHKFGRNYGKNYSLYAHLDERVTKDSPDKMRPMLNAALRKREIGTNPFKRISFQNSKSTDILQLNDLLIGAIGFRRNGHHLRDGAAPHKVMLANHIRQRVSTVQGRIKANSSNAWRFTVWNFAYR